MEPTDNDLSQKMEKGKGDPTTPFPNAQNASAAEINKGDDPGLKNYKGEEDTGPEGPNWNKTSEEADGDTSQNAGTFK